MTLAALLARRRASHETAAPAVVAPPAPAVGEPPPAALRGRLAARLVEPRPWDGGSGLWTHPRESAKHARMERDRERDR